MYNCTMKKAAALNKNKHISDNTQSLLYFLAHTDISSFVGVAVTCMWVIAFLFQSYFCYNSQVRGESRCHNQYKTSSANT